MEKILPLSGTGDHLSDAGPYRQTISLLLQCHPRQQLYLVGSNGSDYALLSLVSGESEKSKGQPDRIVLAGEKSKSPRTGFESLPPVAGQVSLTARRVQAQPDNNAGAASLRVPRLNDSVGQAQPGTVREPQGDSAVQDTIDNTLNQHQLPCTVLVMPVMQLVRWLMDGHPFAWTMMHKATLLHDMGYIVDTDLPVQPQFPSQDDIVRTTTFQRRMAKQFFGGAAFYRSKGSNDLSAFMLHQCTEQCLRALLYCTTGWCPHTHDLAKLVRYCAMTVQEVANIFHGRTPEEARLWRLLRRAYYDARYELYTVMDDDLGVLTRKVKGLMKVLNKYRKG